MPNRVAINGFGRTGRASLRSAHGRSDDVEVVSINDVTDAATLAALLARDSVYGRSPGKVDAAEGAIVVDGREILAPGKPDPAGQLTTIHACTADQNLQDAPRKVCGARSPPR